jgi:HEAT repeat protein
MQSVFDWIQNLGPAGIVLQAILLTVAGIALLLAFILLRRGWRSHLFRRRDYRVLAIRRLWEAILRGAIPPEQWRKDKLSCEIVETILLDSLESAQGEQAAQLLRCLRSSGLLDLRIHEARRARGWQQRRALASLGRMRSPEAIPAMAEALHSRNKDTVMAAVRGLGRLGTPEAAVPLLEHLVSGKLALPSIPVQNALLNCCRWRPQVLVPYVRRAAPEVRALLARALGEVATGDLDEDLLLLACDSQAEVRASAARSLGEARLGVALSALGALAEDDEWFVRLRAIVALGQLAHPRAIPMLVEGLCDRNRFVRLRAAMGLARLEEHLEMILDLAQQKQDRYALQALLSELERSGAVLKLVDRLASAGEERDRAERVLLRTLELGAHRLLVSTLGGHRDRRVRFCVARLLARSCVAALVPLLETAWKQERSARQKKILAWVLEQLRACDAGSPLQMVPAS